MGRFEGRVAPAWIGVGLDVLVVYVGCVGCFEVEGGIGDGGGAFYCSCVGWDDEFRRGVDVVLRFGERVSVVENFGVVDVLCCDEIARFSCLLLDSCPLIFRDCRRTSD